MLSAGLRSSSRSINKVVSRGFRSNAILCQAAPAVASESGGLLSLIFGSSGPKVPPLSDPLPGVNIPPPFGYLPPKETKVTTLANGFTIASEECPGPTATLGIYIDSGSVYETPQTSGMAHLLERMAFKDSTNRSHFYFTRSAEAIGASLQCSASREQMGYMGDALKTYIPEVVELLADTVRNSVFHSWEVAEQVMRVKTDLHMFSMNPKHIILEALHGVGFSGAIGQPLLAPEGNLGNLTPEVILQYVQENYTAPRMVLSGAGVNHDDLVALAEPLFSDMPRADLPKIPETQYHGGDWRASLASKETHVAMAFEVEGGWTSEADAVIVTVLQSLLGGGGSFSAGGPGKGMHSKLYVDVLSKETEIESCMAFTSVYNTTGLFGIHASTKKPKYLPKMVDEICVALERAATPKEVSQEQLERAKNSLISAVQANLDQRMVVAEDIGRQVLVYGKRKHISETLQMVKDITISDVQNMAAKVLQTPLTLVAAGDVSHMPHYNDVAARFH
eukprot:TRINITY_DN1103_c0_g2_i1.p1 TRINITY_DN1103_c0_g2~~TRINITY_DN1103_c0_g2_i1.p1  ORF type:complete len:506 (+),score=72.88 TRINITY_DN1103_c0_g2_i1:94-1611(+)